MDVKLVGKWRKNLQKFVNIYLRSSGFLIGDYNPAFEETFKSEKRLLRGNFDETVLGMGENNQWILDIAEIGSVVGDVYRFIDSSQIGEEKLSLAFRRLVTLATIEEVIHAITNISHTQGKVTVGQSEFIAFIFKLDLGD